MFNWARVIFRVTIRFVYRIMTFWYLWIQTKNQRQTIKRQNTLADNRCGTIQIKCKLIINPAWKTNLSIYGTLIKMVNLSSKTQYCRVHCSSDTIRLMRSRLGIIVQVDDTVISFEEIQYVEVFVPIAKWKKLWH